MYSETKIIPFKMKYRVRVNIVLDIRVKNQQMHQLFIQLINYVW
jgi:hypothetical protein